MDSYQDLIEQGKYELVLKLTQGATDGNSLFNRIFAFTLLGRFEEALYVINDNQKVLEEFKLASLMRLHVEILCSLSRFDQAEAIIDYYSNLPYQSQEVEEVIKELPHIITDYEKKDFVHLYSDEEIVALLNSGSYEANLVAIEVLKEKDIRKYLPNILPLLEKKEGKVKRTLLLMLLSEKEVDRNTNFFYEDRLITVNPKKIHNPFTTKSILNLQDRLENELKNPSTFDHAKNVLAHLVLSIYPYFVQNNEETFQVIYLYTEKLLNPDLDIDEQLKNKEVDIDKVKEMMSKIDDVFKEINPAI